MKKKRSRRSRLRGRRTCGYGSRKKHRGKGSKGGKGLAGSGKRAGQLRMHMLKHGMELGKKGFKGKKKKLSVINLDEIQDKMENLVREGKAKKSDEGIEINLGSYKVLSRGAVKDKLILKAGAFSKKAKEKIEKAGGKAIV